ncbi:hypothetical protein VR44_35160 [Streptomyces katrae]|uniref:Carboxylesterase type B domain-containing protein n=1 Tax=Streptomyces katrae TaxID=68223 RepID=A0A0F4IS85_9ACTN|nr:hypothetical protein VR44_35160 [Streptomyces katrae]
MYGHPFSDSRAPDSTGLPERAGFPFGAAHGFELPHLFTTVPLTAPQAKLAERLTGRWTRFAGAPARPRFAGRGPSVLRPAPGGGGTRAPDTPAAHHCALRDGLAAPVPEPGTGG